MKIDQQSNDAARKADTTTTRFVGATAITLAASMVLQNVMFGVAEAPGYGDPTGDVVAWHVENRVVVAIAVAQEALHVLLLLGFLNGLHTLVGRRGGTGDTWSRLAIAAGATASAIFAFYSVTWIGTVLSTGALAESTATFELAWQLHAAAFAIGLSALGVTAIAVALAAHASRFTPAWQRLLGVAAGGLMFTAGFASLDIADGSAALFVSLPGFFAWIVWLLVTGVRMVRARPTNGLATP